MSDPFSNFRDTRGWIPSCNYRIFQTIATNNLPPLTSSHSSLQPLPDKEGISFWGRARQTSGEWERWCDPWTEGFGGRAASPQEIPVLGGFYLTVLEGWKQECDKPPACQGPQRTQVTYFQDPRRENERESNLESELLLVHFHKENAGALIIFIMLATLWEF